MKQLIVPGSIVIIAFVAACDRIPLDPIYDGIFDGHDTEVGGVGGSAGTGTGNDDGGGAGGSGGAGDGPTGEQACLDFCHEAQANDCDFPDEDCENFCGERLEDAGEQCQDELGEVYACALPIAPSCQKGTPDGCEDEVMALNACVELHGCGGELCSGGGGPEEQFCACSLRCLGKRYDTQCDTPAGGVTTCACLVDGVEVGTCQGEGAQACGLEQSCCQVEYFNIP